MKNTPKKSIKKEKKSYVRSPVNVSHIMMISLCTVQSRWHASCNQSSEIIKPAIALSLRFTHLNVYRYYFYFHLYGTCIQHKPVVPFPTKKILEVKILRQEFTKRLHSPNFTVLQFVLTISPPSLQLLKVACCQLCTARHLLSNTWLEILIVTRDVKWII